MKKSLLILTAILLYTSVRSQTNEGLSLGFGGGFESPNSFKAEAYLKGDFTLFNKPTEWKAGFNNRSYRLEFDGVSDLKASAIGIFADVAIYPFNRGLFLGLRWEVINFNWFAEASKDRFESERGYLPNSLYSGTCIFFQVGYHQRISNTFGIKIYGQPGIQQFRISSGNTTMGGTVVGGNGDGLIQEYYSFIFNANLSLEFRF